ncbi:MAG: hypothetical protein ACLFVR_09835 [Thiohalospira sp.]
MIKNLLTLYNNKRSEFFIALSIVALFLHGKVPYMLPLSISIFFLLIIDVFYTNQLTITSLVATFVNYIKKTWLYLLVVLIFFFAIILHGHNEDILYKELLYSVYIWSIIGFLYVVIKQNPVSEIQFTVYFQKVYIALFLIVLIGIFCNFFKESILLNNLFGIRIDYNYLAFSLITCFLIIIYRYNDLQAKKYIWVWLIYLIVLLIPGLLTGSRRGIFLWVFIHVFLLGYLLWSYYRKSLHKLLFYYFAILFITILSSSIVFYTGSAAFKSYLVERLFPTNYQQVKSQYSQKLYRYSSITNNDFLTFQDQYQKDWNPKPFQSNALVNKMMFNKIHNRFINAFENKEYDEAFSHLIELRNFSSTTEQFLKILPEEYKPFLTKEFVLSDSFPDAPYLYPIPYVDRNFYAINSLENVYPITELKKVNQLPLTFIKTKNDDAYLSLFIPFIPNSQNSIIFYFKGLQANQLEFILMQKNNSIPFGLDINNKLSNGYLTIALNFNVFSKNKGLGQLIIKPKIPINDTLYIGEHWHERIPLKEDYQERNTQRFAKTVKRLQSEKNQRHNNFYERYLSKFKTLSKQKQDSVNFFLDSIHLYRPNFRPYGQHSVLNDNKNDSKTFQSSGYSNYARCFTVVPTVKDVHYTIKLIVKSKKKPNIYVKRYPERTIFDFIKNDHQKEIILINNNTYKIKYQYFVKESTSALGALVVGIRNANENDFFEVSGFKMSIKKDSSLVDVTPYQYSFLEPYIINIIQKDVFGFDNDRINKYLDWKEQNNINKQRVMDSRLVLWRFASVYFKDYSLKEKLFGKGFDYLKVYHHIFDTEGVNSDGVDYPHNPIISALLYSGFVGAIIYIFFLIQVFYRYWKLKKELTLFALLYLLAFAFTFFSGNSHFSVPAFIILSLIPYAYDIKKVSNATSKVKR